MEIFDLHNDILTSTKNAKQIEKYLKNNTKTIITAALWTTKLSWNTIDNKINEFSKLKENNNNLRFAIEDFNFVTATNFDKIVKEKPLYIGLTWNEENILAGGTYSTSGLKPLGRKIINKLNDNNIIIDTAHLNEKSFMEVVNVSNKIICSHTAFSGVFDHKRNLKDYQIKMIIERNGIIGLALVPEFLSALRKTNISDIVEHIEYFVDRYGDDNLSLGSDFFGTKELPKGIKHYDHFSRVENELKKIGYSDETIAKIFYKNAQKFFNEA